MTGFTIGAGHASYRGPMPDGGVGHRHAAFQVAIATDGELGIVDASGSCTRGAALVVRPMAWHRMLPSADLLTFFVEPQSAWADDLEQRCTGDVTAAEGLHLPTSDLGPSRARDHRLLAAMEELRTPRRTIAEVAARGSSCAVPPRHSSKASRWPAPPRPRGSRTRPI
jgi:hypothetical protein